MDEAPDSASIVHRQFDTDQDDPATAVAEAVADLEGCESTDLATMYEHVDHVIDHLFSNPPSRRRRSRSSSPTRGTGSRSTRTGPPDSFESTDRNSGVALALGCRCGFPADARTSSRDDSRPHAGRPREDGRLPEQPHRHGHRRGERDRLRRPRPRPRPRAVAGPTGLDGRRRGLHPRRGRGHRRPEQRGQAPDGPRGLTARFAGTRVLHQGPQSEI
ncbi:HalOD1 output domain-containing protein [Halosimplex aquaticum]